MDVLYLYYIQYIQIYLFFGWTLGCFGMFVISNFAVFFTHFNRRFNSLRKVLQTRSPSISATKEFSDWKEWRGKSPTIFFGCSWSFFLFLDLEFSQSLSMASGTTAFSRASSSAWWVCGWPWMVQLLRPVPPPRFWHRRLFGDFLGDENPQGLDENPIRFQLLEEADAWDIWDEGTKRCNHFSSLESYLEAMKLRVEPMKLRVEPMKLRVEHAKSRLFSLW